MTFRVRHTTTYEYVRPVAVCHNVAHLSPRPSDRQTTRDFQLRIEPEPAVVHDAVDYFGNPVTYFTVQEPHKRLVVTAEHLSAVNPAPPPEPDRTPAWEAVRDRLRTDRRADVLDAYQFAFDSAYAAASADLRAYAAPSFPPGRPVMAAAVDLSSRIYREFTYDPKATDVSTKLADVLAGRRGVCQDFAHLHVACLRSFGLAARYVSGYLRTRPPPGRPRLVGADASHAWASVFCGDAGWVDVDPTNDMVPAGNHITVAWGRDYDDVSPVKGVILGGGRHKVHVAVDVEPVA